MAKRTIYGTISSVGRAGYHNPELPIHLSGSVSDSADNPVGARGKHMTIEMNERTAQWAGAALLRYGWTPAKLIGDMTFGDAFTKAFDREIALGIERAVEAGEKAVEELEERRRAIAARREAERASVIEDSTENGFDPTAYGDR